MNTKTIALVGGGLVIAYLLYDRVQRTGRPGYQTPSAPNPITTWLGKIRDPFSPGLSAGPPTGADIYQRQGPPSSPIPSSVGRQLQQIQTGVDAGVGLAKDLKTTYDEVKDLFSGF